MLELSSSRKQKINLSDYDSEQDIQNRIILSDLTPFDLNLVEEIFFSPLKISLKKLARSLQAEEGALLPILHKLEKTKFLSRQGDTILIDKEMRKYFEFEMQRFNPEFKPDLEFFQGLLRKVPIHILPAWYSVPRSSNNIFESIIEKHFLTPQMFHRYLLDLNAGDPRVQGIMNDVLTANNFRVSSSDLIARYNLSRKDFEEIMLRLEFHFTCCVSYVKEDDHWHEIVTPFREWKQYLTFLKETESPPIKAVKEIIRKDPRDFAFVEDLTLLLQKKPLPAEKAVPLTEKLCLVKLAEKGKGRLIPLPAAEEWLDMTLENRALYLYRHPHNRILSLSVGERYVREAEKSIKRILHGKWVYFDDFLKGVLIPLNEHSVIALKRAGKHWKYVLPVYGEEERLILKAALFEWLYELGMITIGTCRGRDCFAVTHFGRFFFND